MFGADVSAIKMPPELGRQHPVTKQGGNARPPKTPEPNAKQENHPGSASASLPIVRVDAGKKEAAEVAATIRKECGVES